MAPKLSVPSKYGFHNISHIYRIFDAEVQSCDWFREGVFILISKQRQKLDLSQRWERNFLEIVRSDLRGNFFLEEGSIVFFAWAVRIAHYHRMWSGDCYKREWKDPEFGIQRWKFLKLYEFSTNCQAQFLIDVGASYLTPNCYCFLFLSKKRLTFLKESKIQNNAIYLMGVERAGLQVPEESSKCDISWNPPQDGVSSLISGLCESDWYGMMRDLAAARIGC